MAKENETGEKQEPQKPKKGGGMSMPVMAGVIAGVIIVNAIIIVIVFKLFISPSISSGGEAKKGKTEQAAEEKKKKDESEGKETLFAESGRITTNPKNSEKFVVINLGIEYYMSEDAPAAEGEKGLPPKILAYVKGSVNQTIGSMSAEDVHMKRDSLASIFQKILTPTLKKEKMNLKNIIMQEFIIQ